MTIKVIKTRNGDLINFERKRIEIVIEKISKVVGMQDMSFVKIFTDKIVEELNKSISDESEYIFSVSDIEDLVEKKLMEEGYYNVAKEYIIYRQKRISEREKEKIKLDKKLMEHKLKVIKSDGKKEIFDMNKIKNTFDRIINGHKVDCPFDKFEEMMKKYIIDEIQTKDITKMMIKSAIDLISIENIHRQSVAGRLALIDLYKEASINRNMIIDDIYTPSAYKSLFDEYIELGYYYKDFYNYYSEKDILEAGKYIEKDIDMDYGYTTLTMLKKRYLLNPNKLIKELPQEMYMSVALFLAIPEKKENRLALAKKIYKYCANQQISLPTPTLLNARTNYNQLSSCFVMNIADDLRNIYHNVENMAQISKFGGGIGVYLGNIRSKGGYIRGIKGVAGGVNPWIKVINDTAIAVNQLGARNGSISVTLDVWHRDIYDFLDLQTETGDIRRKAFDVFPAISMPDLFMKRVQENGTWTLFDPREIADKTGKNLQDFFGADFEAFYAECEKNPDLELKEEVSAKDLFKKFLKTTVETGMPYVFYRDTVNKLNPNKHAGNVYSTQLCVTGDTRIHCEKGLVKVIDLFNENKETPIKVIYDKRTDFDIKNQGIGIADTIGIYKTGEQQDIFKIDTKEGYSIKSTRYHKYYKVVNKNIEKVELKDLKVGDKLMVQSGKGLFGNKGNYKEGFLLGLLTGDGYIDNNSIGIGLYNELIPLEQEILDYINDLISDNKNSGLFKISNISRKLNNNKVIQHTDNSKRIIINSKRLFSILHHKYGINKNNKLYIPENVYQGSEELVKGYLKGLFLTDGCVVGIPSPKGKIPIPSIQLTSIQLELLEGIQLLLTNFGIQSSIYTSKRKGTATRFSYTNKKGEFKEYESKQSYRLDINGMNAVLFMENIGLYGKKEEKYNAIMNERHKMGFSKKIIGKKQFTITIKEINFIGKEDVYDTTQLYNHSLIFNGIVTGNCVEINQNTSPSKFVEEIFEDGKIIIKYEPGDTVVCNLASINVAKVNTDSDIKKIIPVAMRILDNVIDLNFYPVKESELTAKKYRSVGLGFLGLAEYLAVNKLAYDSEEARNVVDKLFEKYSYSTLKASNEIAKERGTYEVYEGSEWSKGIFFGKDEAWFKANSTMSEEWLELIKNVKKDGMRFAYHLAPAPNTSTAMVVGTTASILPIYKKYFVETNKFASSVNVAPNLNAENFWFYKEYVNMNMNDVIDMVSVVYKWIDQSVSFEWIINPEKVSPAELYSYYIKSWKQGIKTVYYVRSMSLEVKECVSCSG